MQEIKLYQCSFCHTQYKEKFACKQCEANHKKNLVITKARYVGRNINFNGFPIAITVRDENGNEMVYRR